MPVDCSIFPGPDERPLPDQPGGGKVRIGQGGTPVVFPGDKCDFNFISCAGNGPALGANILYFRESPIDFLGRVFLAGGQCVELDSTGCSGSCEQNIIVTANSTLLAQPVDYELISGDQISTGYQTTDVVSSGITGDYNCWWGRRFSLDESLNDPDFDNDIGFADLTLAKHETFTVPISGSTKNFEEVSGGWVIMARFNQVQTSYGDAAGVFYFTNNDTENISGNYEFLGYGGIPSEDVFDQLTFSISGNPLQYEKPCPTIVTDVPIIDNQRKSYRFNKCNITAFRFFIPTESLVEIRANEYPGGDLGSEDFFLRYYGNDDTYTYQIGDTVISDTNTNSISTTLFAPSGYNYITLQNQDDDTDRFSYTVSVDVLGSAGNVDQALGPISGNPLDSLALCPCDSILVDSISAYPPGIPAVDLSLDGAPPDQGNVPSAIGTILTEPITAQVNVCPCPIVTSIAPSATIPTGSDGTMQGGPGPSPGDFVGPTNPLLPVNIDAFYIECPCVSSGNEFIESINMIPGQLDSVVFEPGASPATNLDALVPDITSGLFLCPCDGPGDVEGTVNISPTGSTSVYISGGLDFEDVINSIYCEAEGLFCDISAGPLFCIPITGGSNQFDYNFNSFLENGWTQYTVTETGGISAAQIILDGTIDGNPLEVRFRIVSPNGVVLTIDGNSLGGAGAFNYDVITTAFNADTMEGTWRFEKIDTVGDGGLGIDNTSMLCLNPDIAGITGSCAYFTTGDGSGTLADPFYIQEGDNMNAYTDLEGDNFTYFSADASSVVTIETGNAGYGLTSDTVLEYYGNDDTFTVLLDFDDDGAGSGYSVITTTGETGCIYFRVRDFSNLSRTFNISVT